MARLGGSPLGLIGLQSKSTSVGWSSFNGGDSSNFDVQKYNTGGSIFSQFTGKRRLRAWPNISSRMKYAGEDLGVDSTGYSDVIYKAGGGLDDKSKPSKAANSKGSNLLHNNDVYDTSVLNIVEKLSGTKAALRPSDFAYLRDLGAFPNNRLMIARRFYSPSGDNIMTKVKPGQGSIATLISWLPEGDNFIEITFGEVWDAAKADFTGMLNSLGDDFAKKGLGGIAGAAGNVLPLPGFTEIFQRKFLEKLGILEAGAGDSIPAGNPNLIKEAKVRKTVPYNEAGSGLTCKVSVKMLCEYELKFISGIDPTIVWMDIISNAARFGTSESSNYGLSQEFAGKISKWSSDPYQLIDDTLNGIANAIKGAKDELTKTISDTFNKATAAAANLSKESNQSDQAAALSAANEEKSMSESFLKGLLDLVKDGVSEVVRASVLKYRVEVMGIVNALTGNPSTPWHITIGNPLRPAFCSGDMITTDVNLKLGPILAFNDLPSSITVEFTLTNARNWGLQEIMAKFNSGYLRTVDIQKTFFETTITTKGGKTTSEEKPGMVVGDKDAWRTIKPPEPPPIAATGSVSEGGGNTPTGGGTQSAATGGGTQSAPVNNSPTNVNVPSQNTGTASSAPGSQDQQSKTTGGQATTK
jgi:hypothetical protein